MFYEDGDLFRGKAHAGATAPLTKEDLMKLSLVRILRLTCLRKSYRILRHLVIIHIYWSSRRLTVNLFLRFYAGSSSRSKTSWNLLALLSRGRMNDDESKSLYHRRSFADNFISRWANLLPFTRHTPGAGPGNDRLVDGSVQCCSTNKWANEFVTLAEWL